MFQLLSMRMMPLAQRPPVFRGSNNLLNHVRLAAAKTVHTESEIGGRSGHDAFDI